MIDSLPIVSILRLFNFCPVFLPIPGSLAMGNGARKARSLPTATSSSPSGLLISEATLAITLPLAMPIEAVSPSSSLTRCFIFTAI
ncbi:hypothetical protein ES703_10911 [subsurface metagenome]